MKSGGAGAGRAPNRRSGLLHSPRGKGNCKPRPFSKLALHRQVPTHQVAELFADGQTQAGAAILLGRRDVGLRECLEELAQLLWRHTDAVVADAELDLGVATEFG